MIWLLYLFALKFSRSGNVTKQAIDFFRGELEYTAWEGSAAKASVGWHCRLVNLSAVCVPK